MTTHNSSILFLFSSLDWVCEFTARVRFLCRRRCSAQELRRMLSSSCRVSWNILLRHVCHHSRHVRIGFSKTFDSPTLNFQVNEDCHRFSISLNTVSPLRCVASARSVRFVEFHFTITGETRCPSVSFAFRSTVGADSDRPRSSHSVSSPIDSFQAHGCSAVDLSSVEYNFVTDTRIVGESKRFTCACTNYRASNPATIESFADSGSYCGRCG